jgi:Holliday junction resolvase RusA-like endonuclease
MFHSVQSSAQPNLSPPRMTITITIVSTKKRKDDEEEEEAEEDCDWSNVERCDGDDDTPLIDVEVPGKPVCQQRARFARGRVYDPSCKEKANFNKRFWEVHAESGGGAPPVFEVPLRITLTCTFPRLQKHFARTGELRDDAPTYFTNTPDVDNLAKFVMDALNGTLYKDDRQVVDLHVVKRWSDSRCGGSTRVVASAP